MVTGRVVAGGSSTQAWQQPGGAAPGPWTGAQEGGEVEAGRKRTAGQGPVGCALIPVRAGVAAIVILAVLGPAIGGMLSCI